MKYLTLPLKQDIIHSLKAGQEILLSGVVYTARDQAHKRLVEILKKDSQRLPFDIRGAVIYYCGPNPAMPGKVIGSCGPTTSSRMDRFTPPLLSAGLRGMIGKGRRSQYVTEAIKKFGSVYFITFAGAGAYLYTKVSSSELLAFEDLGPEAIFKLQVKDFPAIVAIDSKGRSVF